MKYLSIALIYLGFFALIGFACWVTDSPIPLVALVVLPEINSSTEEQEESDENENLQKS